VKARSTIRKKRPEAGIALLIAIFVLLLISVVAIALIVSSGTESALAGNYRNATSVYYAALAGLEEGRGRLSSKSSNSFATTAAGFLPSPMVVGHPIYIINPAGGETVAPWDPGSLYPDTEFNPEFSSSGFTLPNPSPWTASVSTVAGIQGPMYKWVRINAVSEKSLNLDVFPFDGTKSPATPVFYDGTQLNDANTGAQVLEITSLAVLPNGSQKLLQYVVAPINLDLSFSAALILDGTVNSGSPGDFYPSGTIDFFVKGLDQQIGPTCTPVESPKYAIGTIDGTASSGSLGEVIGGIPYATRRSHYVGIATAYAPPPSPSMNNIGLVSAFQTVNSLDGPQGVVQSLTGLADQHVTGPATSLPDYGTPTRMVTTVVAGGPPNGGDLALSGSVDGYGLLVVTGNLDFQGSVSWHGVILVIGQGHMNISTYAHGKIDGAVLIARTRHSDYSLRAGLGRVTFTVTDVNDGNDGIYYNSCSVLAALPSNAYKILSFHEIPQP
jgi:hypothetical protein